MCVIHDHYKSLHIHPYHLFQNHNTEGLKYATIS